MLDDLIRVIETIQNRIREHGSLLRENETRTRMALIDPLLTALGWDTADPKLVTPEFNVGSRRADYGLLDEQGMPVVFLEAKHLDENLSNHRSQVAAYASELGIKYPALTNGDSWEVYDNSKLVPIEQRRILDVSLAKEAVHHTALKLLLLWHPNLASVQPVPANEPIFSAQQAAPDPQPTHIQHPVTVAPPSPSGEGWTSILNLPPDVSWRNLPSTIRFPNGEKKPINPKQWKRVLAEAAEWLISNGGLTKDKCPIGQDSDRYIIHTEPMQPTGKAFFFPAQLSNGLFMASASNAKKAADDCVYLMKYCDQDPSRVELWLEE